MIAPEAWATILEGYKANGFGYAPYPDMTENYGISLSRPSEIVAMVEDIPGVRLLCYTERGWGDNHDVLGVLGTDRLAPLGSLAPGTR